MLEGLVGQHAALVDGESAAGERGGDPRVVVGVDDHGHGGEALGRGAQERRAADVDVLDRSGERAQVHHHEARSFDLLDADRPSRGDDVEPAGRAQPVEEDGESTVVPHPDDCFHATLLLLKLATPVGAALV